MESQATVLVIDDDYRTRATLEALLSSQGCHLVFAADGPEGLALAAGCHPDVVLLDVMMPGMDGFEVCRRLRADAALAQVPVLLITALDDRDARLAGFEAGADDFISKPFDRVELRARVRNTLKLNRYRRLLAERNKFEWVVGRAPDGYLLLDAYDRIVYANTRAGAFLGLADDADASHAWTGESSFIECAKQHYRLEPAAAWSTWPVPAGGPDAPWYLVTPATTTARAGWLQVEVLDFPGVTDASRLVRLSDVSEQVADERDLWAVSLAVMHKLNTPLTIHIASLELLASGLENGSTSEVTELASMALRGAQRLNESVEQVLEYLGLSARQPDGFILTLDCLPGILSQLSTASRLPLPRLTTTSDLHRLVVPLSRQSLELILHELLRNAQRFHPENMPEVEVVVDVLTGGELRIEVRDNGIWLSPEQLARSWWPFWQGDRYFTGQKTGMGLGLTMVTTLVWEIGGRCTLRNRSDKPGICVELVFPVPRAALSANSTAIM